MESIAVTGTAQEAIAALPDGWRDDGGVVELRDGENGPIRIEQGGRDGTVDLVLRAPAGKVAVISGAGGAPISTDVAEKRLRIVIDGRQGEIHTDCEREYTEKVEHGVLMKVYEGEPMVALDLAGVEEAVVLGRGTAKGIYGQTPVTRSHFDGEVRLLGDTLRHFLADETIRVWTRKPPDEHQYEEPS